MIIKFCLPCEFHEMKQDGKEDESLPEGKLLVSILQVCPRKGPRKVFKRRVLSTRSPLPRPLVS